MNTRRSYLDHNATSPLRPQARAAMLAALEVAGNPSSIHAEGRAARALIETARGEVAALVGVRAEDVVFTSGGTEAINTVVGSSFDAIVLSGIEHDSVREAARATGGRIVELAVNAEGVIEPGQLDRALDVATGCGEILVSLQLANNETGVIQQVPALAVRSKARGAVVFADAVQAAGKMPISFAELGVDAIAISAHKLGGPKGVGAVVTTPALRLAPLLRGGGQERRRRAGTENVAGIAGFGAAAKAARETLEDAARLAGLRGQLEREILAVMPEATIAGAATARLPNTSCIVVPGASAETQVIRFDLAGIAVSSGSACSSGKVGKSHVLQAMGLGDLAGSAIRVSLGWNTIEAEVAHFVAAFAMIYGTGASRSVA